jgi:hypothetical protein
MTPDELQQQEELGRKSAAALAPLGLSPQAVALMAADYAPNSIPLESARFYRDMATSWITLVDHDYYARAAGVAAWFEEQGK